MPHILLVDDDESVRKVLHRMLVDAGYEVEDAANGAIALAAYKRRRRDLVITDILMPEKEGLETVRELRWLDPGAKIIAMSGAGGGPGGRGAGYLAIALLFGAVGVLSKPFSTRDVLEAVVDVVGLPVAALTEAR